MAKIQDGDYLLLCKALVDNLDSSVSSNFGKDVTFMDGKPVHIQDVAK